MDQHISDWHKQVLVHIPMNLYIQVDIVVVLQ